MFIGGLKPEVGTSIRMFQTTTLSETYRLARMQEATNTILKPREMGYIILTDSLKESWRTKGLRANAFIVSKNGDDETYKDCVGDMVEVTDSPQITLNALSGLNSYQTMRVRGRVVFTSDVMLLPLGDCEMVLGIQWLATLRDMQCNFKKLIMKFNHKGRQLVLRGMNNTHVHWMQGKEGMLKQAELSSMALCVYPVQLCQMEIVVSVSAEVEQVLTKFDKVFEVPKDLPPQRSHDHQIPLMPNTPPINVRPYKHPPNQKDAIEGMVKELMDSGVIRAIKDKLPIPVMEELINELNGSVVFSKLDLRSGYHQIRMKEDDICKRDFRTREGHYEFLVMPFRLTNAPSTFQSPMNTVFKAFLRKFVLVFFDDILIYIKSLKEHCNHLAQVLQVMKDNTLYAKKSKCYFAIPQVEYLGHIISAQGVSVDPSKIEAMQKWPIPSTLKQLRGFLGLTGYYKRFIKEYASISQSLVALTKKDAFKWNPSAELAYHKLKEAMVKAPVLALPNFEQEFVVETDASGKGIGAVLCQNGHPIAYWSKTLSAKHQALSTYEKEFLAVVAALDKWKGYLLDRHFKIRTDHFSLKYLLNQKLTTPFQFKWLPKLLGYDYEIVYKKGSENVVADALSRMDSSGELLQISVSSVSSGVWDKVKDSWKNDLDTQNLIKSLEHHSYKGNKYSWTGEILKRKGKVKPDLSAYPGLIQPLPIPERIWKEISMDFIEKLPTSHGKSVILVVVDRLSKYAHFIPLAHPFTASQVAQVFLDQVYKLHGLPESIVSDRDKVFLSNFWKALFAELKLRRQLSSVNKAKGLGKQKDFNLSYYGPFKVAERIGEVAYRFELPILPQLREDGLLENRPMAILERRLGKVNNKPVMFVLIQWTNKSVEEVTWEIYGDLIARFPGFDVVNEVVP
ncbi:putative mitochondrial protein [Tanacetum coccineum]